MIIPLVLGFILGAAALLFVLQNTTIVALSFLGRQFESSVAILVLISILVGSILTLLLVLPSAIGSRLRMRRLRKHNEALANEAALHKQAADDANARLMAAQTPHPDVIDLSS
jgi:uncharacterized integral membrane protein